MKQKDVPNKTAKEKATNDGAKEQAGKQPSALD